MCGAVPWAVDNAVFPVSELETLCLQLPPEWKIWATVFWLQSPCTDQPLHLDPGSLVVHQPFRHLHIPSVGHMEPQNLPILQEAMKHQQWPIFLQQDWPPTPSHAEHTDHGDFHSSISRRWPGSPDTPGFAHTCLDVSIVSLFGSSVVRKGKYEYTHLSLCR